MAGVFPNDRFELARIHHDRLFARTIHTEHTPSVDRADLQQLGLSEPSLEQHHRTDAELSDDLFTIHLLAHARSDWMFGSE